MTNKTGTDITPKCILDVAMFAPTRTGKTTLLCSMWYQFKMVIRGLPITFLPADDGSIILNSRLTELKASMKPWTLGLGDGIGGTSSPRDFPFDFRQQGNERPVLRVNFKDIPGGYLQSRNPDNFQLVHSLVRNSVALIIPVDSASLMEENGDYHQRNNQPLLVADLIEKAYMGLDSPRLVILAPIKCEAYMRESKRIQELNERLRKGYDALFHVLDSDHLRNQTTVVIAPVQTLGAVVFSRVSPDGKFIFRMEQPDSVYNPLDTDQPLRYLLRFLIKMYLNQQASSPFNFFRRLLGLDQPFIESAKKIARECKRTGGFQVIGETWLDID